MTLIETIRKIVADTILQPTRIGKAVNIDTAKGTCDVQISEEVFLHQVKLKVVATNEKEGLTIIPETNSQVIAGMVDGLESHWVLVQYSKIKAVYINTTEKIYLNGDNKGGVPISEEISKKLNVVEKQLNDLKNVFSSWIPAPNDGGAALKAAATNWIADQVITTKKAELENKKVQHGDQ